MQMGISKAREKEGRRGGLPLSVIRVLEAQPLNNLHAQSSEAAAVHRREESISIENGKVVELSQNLVDSPKEAVRIYSNDWSRL